MSDSLLSITCVPDSINHPAATIERDAAQQQSAQRESLLDSKLSKLQAELAASQRQVEELRLALFARQSQAEEVTEVGCYVRISKDGQHNCGCVEMKARSTRAHAI